MPPTILGRNAVEDLAARLTSEDIPKQVIAKAAELGRILETRMPSTKLGKNDRNTSRAAVLLELAYRTETKTRLPWSKLTPLVKLTVNQLEQLQQHVNNHLQDATTSSTSFLESARQRSTQSAKIMEQRLANQAKHLQTTNASRKRCLSHSVPSIEHKINPKKPMEDNLVRRSTRPRSPQVDERRLEELSLKLNLMDPHGACQRAKKLLEEALQSISRDPFKCVTTRNAELYQFVRYTPAYEAAALLCVADDNNLPMAQVAEASTEFTHLELKEVLPHMKELAEKVQFQTADARPSGHSSEESRVAEMDVDGPTTTSRMELEEEERRRREEEDEVLFSKWQDEVLNAAMEQARANLQQDEERADGESLTEEKLLSLAADDILQKYGLL